MAVNASTVPPVTGLEEEKKDGVEGVEGADGDAPRPMYERYEYLDPKKFTAICTLNIQLIAP